MKFKFDVALNDNDYLELNVFWMTKSVYGKKTSLVIKLLVFLMGAMVILLGFLNEGITVGSVFATSLFAILIFLIICFYDKYMRLIVKWQITMLKGKGKLGYTPQSVIEFFDESFIESTPDSKREERYSSVERISVVGEKAIYIHLNSVGAYLLPYSCFESKEQYEEFIDFLKTKCNSVDCY